MRQRQSELKSLEKRESAICYNAKARAKQKQSRRLKVLASEDQATGTSTVQETTFITENNNITSQSVGGQQDVRPKLGHYISKLSLSDELTAYEKTLAHGRMLADMDSSATAPRKPKRTTSDNILYKSLRLGKDRSFEGKVS